MRHVFTRFLEKAELRQIRIHDLQHHLRVTVAAASGVGGLREGAAWAWQH
jgi:hypothetical protein